jgi:PRC-barrel domain
LGFRACTEDAQPLGSINGVLISPSSRQLRYFVIETPGLFAHRRFLLPAEAGVVVDEDSKTLQIGARKDELALQTFKLKSVPQFSDTDLLETMFSTA